MQVDISTVNIRGAGEHAHVEKSSTHQKATPNLSITQKVSKIAGQAFWTLSMVVDPIVGFYTQALSDLLALETLRHGTNYHNYLSIRMNGADPAYGGSENGACAGAGNARYAVNSKNFFHVFKDTEARMITPTTVSEFVDAYMPKATESVDALMPQVANRLYPRAFCYLSAVATVKGTDTLNKIQRVFTGVLNALVVPTINFRFRPEEIATRFENDPDFATSRETHEGLAHRTRVAISTDHIGLKGVLTQGFQGDVSQRMVDHPIKFTFGLIKLIVPTFGFISLLKPVGFILLAGTALVLTGKELSNRLCGRTVQRVNQQ